MSKSQRNNQAANAAGAKGGTMPPGNKTIQEGATAKPPPASGQKAAGKKGGKK